MNNYFKKCNKICTDEQNTAQTTIIENDKGDCAKACKLISGTIGFSYTSTGQCLCSNTFCSGNGWTWIK